MAPGGRIAADSEGRSWIVVIGVARYRAWPGLGNAVNDAHGVLAAFERLGFAPAAAPLIDDGATRDALHRLANDDLRRLEPADSLVVFFAGHGHTEVRDFGDGPPIRKGFLVPVDADLRQRNTWLNLTSWLSDLACLPPRHLLVILDACRSGVALDGDIRWRASHPIASAIDPRHRMSRRVITSALDDQRALDDGPRAGHSVFAGCLIDALRGGMYRRTRETHATGTGLGDYLRWRVRKHTRDSQIPAIGALEGDYAGEIFIPLIPPRPARPSADVEARARGKGTSMGAISELLLERDVLSGRSVIDAGQTDTWAVHAPTEGWALAPALEAELARHDRVRLFADGLVSVIPGDAMPAAATWATWAARHGRLTLLATAAEPALLLAELLAQIPWLRCVAGARTRLATAAGIAVAAVDAALDARTPLERRGWIEQVAERNRSSEQAAERDRDVSIAGWLLSALREPQVGGLDLATAPVRGMALLQRVCELGCPMAVLLHHPSPTVAWFERARDTAMWLAHCVPYRGVMVAIAAPAALAREARPVARPSAERSPPRAWDETLELPAPPLRMPGRSRHRSIRALFRALAADPRTHGQFQLDAEVAVGDHGLVLDAPLLAPAARVAIELDTWFHFSDPEAHERERAQDARLSRAGYFVMRCLAEDLDARLPSIIDEIALVLAARRAAVVGP